MLTITCKDNQHVNVPMEVIEYSAILSFLYKQSNQNPVQFNMLNSTSVQECIQLSLILKEDHPIIERPLRSNFIEDYLSERTIEAMKKFTSVYEMIDAADILGFTQIFDVGSIYVGFELKNKTCEQIREKYHIIDDFSSEEKEKISKYFGIIQKVFN